MSLSAVASYFIYEIRELRRRLIGSRNTLVSYSPKLSYAELTLSRNIIMNFSQNEGVPTFYVALTIFSCRLKL
ncbi:hypothetical protein D1609_16520 [Leptospira borgpetersenii serovar Hardjo-bovis]|nr:hypothetical protein D1609_16520 [Leptospira borgpetersenii serovar Hardjo-bovis]